MRQLSKPKAGEYAPYASMYIDLLPGDGRVLQHLKDGFEEVRRLVSSLPEDTLTRRYAQGKWSIKEILVHIVDDERIYAYRALRFARGDRAELPGFEQDDYARTSGADERPLASILAEYQAVREATVAMFDGLPEEAFERSGIADGNPMSVRAAVYHIAGHELHHLKIIRERYL